MTPNCFAWACRASAGAGITRAPASRDGDWSLLSDTRNKDGREKPSLITLYLGDAVRGPRKGEEYQYGGIITQRGIVTRGARVKDEG